MNIIIHIILTSTSKSSRKKVNTNLLLIYNVVYPIILKYYGNIKVKLTKLSDEVQ